jgi:thiol-disulfide isomerase/thioredoxin
MKKHICLLIFLFFSSVLLMSQSMTSINGLWRGTFFRQDGVKMPFLFELMSDSNGELALYLINGIERIRAEKTVMRNDSIIFHLAYFDTELKLKVDHPEKLSGIWVDNSRDNMSMPFEAVKLKEDTPPSATSLSGKWELLFRPGFPNAFPGILNIGLNENKMLSTSLRAPSGDYRYMVTEIIGDSLVLYKFDGIVSYLLTAHIQGDSLVNGKMYSGTTYQTEWKGFRNEAATLPDAFERTKVISNEFLTLRLRDIKGDSVMLERKDFIGKITLLPIMGTWCPNCLDESGSISQYLKNHPEMPIQVFGLCFERPKEWEKIDLLLNKYTRMLQLPFPLYYAGYADAASASKTFPMLDGIKAFPTLIIIDKTGQIRKVITGFDGPATGQAYVDHQQRFDALMQQLSQE